MMTKDSEWQERQKKQLILLVVPLRRCTKPKMTVSKIKTAKVHEFVPSDCAVTKTVRMPCLHTLQRQLTGCINKLRVAFCGRTLRQLHLKINCKSRQMHDNQSLKHTHTHLEKMPETTHQNN